MNVNFHTPIFWNGWTPKSHQMGKKQKLLSFGNKLMTIEVHIVYLSYSKPKKFFFFFFKEFQSMTFTFDDNFLSSDQYTNWFLV